MYIKTLQIQSVRNLIEIQINCSPGINLIFGKNAAGKTSLLEAICILSRSISFRTPRIEDVIQHEKKQLTVTADIQETKNGNINTGIEKSREKTQIKYNGTLIKKRSEQARNLPVFILGPENQQLITGTPRDRRKWLDWSLFHVEQDYHDAWLKYHDFLRRRNALLRQNAQDSQFGYWENVISEQAEKINNSRTKYLAKLQEFLEKRPYISQNKLRIIYNQEFLQKSQYLEKLAQNRNSDKLAGYTQHGAHRADVVFKSGDKDAAKTFSQGQNKKLQLYLLLAQAGLYFDTTGILPIILLDDLAAELDSGTRNEFIEDLATHSYQSFITTIEQKHIPKQKIPIKTFHVEHGNVTEMVE